MGDIILKNVVLKYGNDTVLNNINLEIKTGEFITFAGYSGSGKTSLLKTIAGLVFLTSGEVIVDGESIYKLTQAKMLEYHTKSGYIFPHSALISNMSIYENLTLYYHYNTDLTDEEIDEIIKKYIELVDYKDSLEVRPAQLSSGDKMKIAVVRAISHNPDYLFCDNTFSQLDSKASKVIQKILINLKENGKTILYGGIINKFIMRISDRIIVLDKGKIILDNKPEEIINNNYDKIKDLIIEE